MSQTTQLIDALKRLLKARGLSYGKIAPLLDLSEASVKRLFAEESFNLQKLERLCDALDIDFYELARLARGALDAQEAMSQQQEQALADDPKLLAVFYLVYNDWQLKDICVHYEITSAQCITYLLRLEKLRIIDVLPNNLIQLKLQRNVGIRSNGPIRAKYGDIAMENFLSVRFEEHEGHFRFEFRELSPASFEILKRKLDRIAAEFLELAALDSTLPIEQKQSIGIGVGMRPWEIGLITGLKAR